MNEDRKFNVSVLEEVPFNLSHFTINGNVQFNFNYNDIQQKWTADRTQRDVNTYIITRGK